MNRLVVVLAGLVLLLAGSATAGELQVTEGVITSAIVDREPVDAVQSHSAAAGRLHCFTRVAGGDADAAVQHVWYWGEREMARIDLAVRAADWRTWSSKAILPEWTGQWRVEVLDGAGNLLKTIPFTLH